MNLRTNSREVVASAQESWGAWAPEFDNAPIEVRIVVQDRGELAPEPVFRSQAHLFSVVSDQDNYAVMDLDALFGYAFLSERTVRDHSWFRWFFLDTMALWMIAQRYTMAVHAACVARDGAGILLCGRSGAGKSTLAWACARSGWTYLTDDSSWLLMDGRGREVLGRPHQARFRHDAPALFPELQGYVSRVRPNGKLTIEVPTSLFPGIRTAPRCEIGAAVFLDRSGRRPAGYERIRAVEAAEEILGEYSSLYRDEVRAGYRRRVQRMLEAPAYRLRYKNLEEGIELLGDLHAGLLAG